MRGKIQTRMDRNDVTVTINYAITDEERKRKFVYVGSEIKITLMLIFYHT
ncbi:hypothetical protein [Clostridium estertheticum]|nr:hypothetical protein [Clostridium estertheticum]MBW9151592.1 hypothetical protein [Clostridium estertheticum]WLC83279.1 hypothetical protein KTC97_14390 [Clostridium estertheticum]